MKNNEWKLNVTYCSLNPVRILLSRDYSAASVAHLAPHIQEYILEKAALCQPDDIYVCNGSDAGDSLANWGLLANNVLISRKGKDHRHAAQGEADQADPQARKLLLGENRS